ncbi:MAG: DUF4261 domain-containing protein [Planctomycetales bacterium]|nr:DUF4261 domain-containing protein [Planctomycetales bacterium]
MASPASNPLRWLALVVLDQPRMPDFDEVARFVGQSFPDALEMTVSGSTEALFTCSLGDYTAAVTLVDRPIPWGQLEGPCATAWYWPDAETELRDHNAHLLVTLIDEGAKAIEKSTLLTQLVAGVVSSSPTLGVFWGPGRLVHPPRAFLEQALQMSPKDLPLFLWVDFRVERLEPGMVRLYTTGLEALGHSELEVPEFQGAPQTLLEYAYNIAHYQVTQPKYINDGHTIGLTDEVQVVAHHGRSMFDEGIEVIRLEFQLAGDE